MLDVDAIQTALQRTRFAGHFHHLSTTASTNELALAAAREGQDVGVWIADEQTAGRGRGDHRWHSPPGAGLYVSVLTSPRISSRSVLYLAMLTGLAAQSAIKRCTGVAVDLRWPNDLMIGHRKCGGILVELAMKPVLHASQNAALRFAVIGVGINVGQAGFPPELMAKATSLRLETGRHTARELLLISLLSALDTELYLLETDAASENHATTMPWPTGLSLLQRFAGNSSWVQGKRVTVDGRYTGTTAGLTSEGFLQVLTDEGELCVVRSGGVRSEGESP